MTTISNSRVQDLSNGSLAPTPSKNHRTDPPTLSIDFSAMGTTVHIVIVSGDDAMLADAKRLIESLESKWSRFRPESEVTKLNRSEGNPCIVSEPTFDLISKAIGAWRASNGAFDPTIEASIRSAGYAGTFSDLVAGPPALPSFGNQTPDDPKSRGGFEEVGDVVPAPTPQGIWTDHSTRLVQLPVGTTLDLGGIAKGAAADIVAEQLILLGALGCCVNIGGDIRMLGQGPRPTGWIVNLDVPGSDLPALALKTGAVCTSTTKLRRWLNRDGSIEHHVRDPRTGRASTTDVESVVVIAERALQAEVLTKMVLLGGSSLAQGIFEASQTTGFLVTVDGEIKPMAGTQDFIAGFG